MNTIKILLAIVYITYSCIKAEYLTTSLIIPCHPKHAKYLYELLKIYEKQTTLPDEVVISISERNQVDPDLIKSLQDEKWLFPVKLILSEEKLFAGQNRNIACRNAIGEIFICQDADDIPHRQRIQVIKYFFDKFKLDFLLHRFVYNQAEAVSQLRHIDDISSLEYYYIKSYHEAWIIGYILFGQPALHRRVFQKIQWPNIPIDEDNTFDSRVIENFKNCVMLTVPLYIYRTELSVTPYHLYRLINPLIKSLFDLCRYLPNISSSSNEKH